MKIQVFHIGQLMTEIEIDIPRGAFIKSDHEARALLIREKVKEVRHSCIKVMGEAGKAVEIHVVAGSLMNAPYWERLGVFEDVLEYLQEKKAG